MAKGSSFYPLSTIHYSRRLVLVVAIGLAACAPKGDALYNRAEQALAKGEARAAVIDLKDLVDTEPQNARARALLGQALVESGDIQAGAIEIQKAKDLGAPKDMIIVPECRVLLAKSEFDKVLSQCKPDAAPASAKVEMQVAQGRALLGLDRAADAKGQFEAVLQAQPGNFDALLGLASATYKTDGLAAAKGVLDQAPNDVKQRSAYWMTMGGIATEGGDFPAAEKAFSTAVEKAGKSPASVERLSALGALAEAQMRQGKVKEATATSDQLIKAAPDNPLAKQLRGQVAAAGRDYEKARTLLEQAVAAMPENYQARLLLGMVNMQQGNIGQAEVQLAEVVAHQPGNVQAQRLLAEVRARSQSPAETLEALKPALAQDSADPALLAMAGRLSLASGNREQALAYLAQASTQATARQSPDAQIEVAGGYLMAGDFDRAIETLKAMPEGGATGYQREYLMLLALLRKGDNEKAVAEANALVAKSGNDAAVRNLVAGVLAAAGQKDAGRAQFNEALKLKPNDPQTLLNLGRLDLAEGRNAEAEVNFRKILESDPKNLMAELGIAVAAGARGDARESEKWLQKAAADHPESVDAQLALAQYYLGTRDYGKAKAVIDAAARKSPDNAALSNARGLMLLGLNDAPGAIASFKQATEQAPEAYGYSLNLARAHLVNRDLNSALDVLNGVLKAEPKFLPALSLAAAASLQGGDLEKAAGYVERMKQAAPDSQGTYALEGDLAMAQKRYKDALADYRKASAKGMTRELAIAEYRAGVMSGAAQPHKVLEDWVSAHPDDVDVVAVLADAEQRRGNIDGAIKLYEQVLPKSPGNAVLLNNLAVLYQAKGNPKALEYGEKAYKAAPKVAAIQDTYGWILFQNGDTAQAMPILEQAYKGLPDNAEVQYHYAAVLARKGQAAEAVSLLRKSVGGTLPPDVRAEADKLLRQLSK